MYLALQKLSYTSYWIRCSWGIGYDDTIWLERNLLRPPRRSTRDARRPTADTQKSGRLGSNRIFVSWTSALEARRSTLGARRSTPDARRPTLDARRSTLGARRSTLDGRRPTLDARRSTLDARRSTLDARRSTLEARGLTPRRWSSDALEYLLSYIHVSGFTEAFLYFLLD